MKRSARNWFSALGAVALIAHTGACKQQKGSADPDPGAAAAAAAPIPPSPSPLTDPQTTTLEDHEIKAAIEREMFVDGAVNGLRVDVDVSDGIVELTGTVPDLMARERAERLASTVKGVRALSSRIEVASEERPDDEIESDIETALLIDPAAERFELDVAVKDGIVTLGGEVQSWQEKMLAERIAKGVRGVQKVSNEIRLDYASLRTDREIAADVRSRLRWDALVDHGLLDVTVEDGVVILSGTVGSLAERNQAERDAWVAGTKDVRAGDVAISWWAREGDLRRSKYVIESDEEIRAAIADALAIDPRVSTFNVTPRVMDRFVTLTGTVTSLKAKLAAENVARNTTGVIGVANDLVIAGTPTFAEGQRVEGQTVDDALAERIRNALLVNPVTESFEIDVKVADGVAILGGEVDSYGEKAEAEDVASSLVGIRAVDNRLVADSPRALIHRPYGAPYFPLVTRWEAFAPGAPLTDDTETRSNIEYQLFWSPFVDAEQVDVAVKDGVATLTGTVDTPHERWAATSNAFEGGAIRVENRLKVKR